MMQRDLEAALLADSSAAEKQESLFGTEKSSRNDPGFCIAGTERIEPCSLAHQLSRSTVMAAERRAVVVEVRESSCALIGALFAQLLTVCSCRVGDFPALSESNVCITVTDYPCNNVAENVSDFSEINLYNRPCAR